MMVRFVELSVRAGWSPTPLTSISEAVKEDGED